MSLMFEPLRKYANFSGRARRKEYWLWQLFLFLLFFALATWLRLTVGPLEQLPAPGLETEIMVFPKAMQLPLVVASIAGLGLFLPSLAVIVRRIHDSGNSGWWILILLTGVGGIVLLIFGLMDGTPGENRYGPDPKGRPSPHYS